MDDTQLAAEQNEARRLSGSDAPVRTASASSPCPPPRQDAPGTSKSPGDASRPKRSPEEVAAITAKALEILREETPVEPLPPAGTEATGEISSKDAVAAPAEQRTPDDKLAEDDKAQLIPARMLNEFVYCQRLFYYEFVEGVFVESADTLRGSAIHTRVDSGSGEMPGQDQSKVQSAKSKVGKKGANKNSPAGTPALPGNAEAATQSEETIHSRSVQMGSDRLGVTAKMDLVELRPIDESKVQSLMSKVSGESQTNSSGADDTPATQTDQTEFTEQLFRAWEVCPVDYKAGAPKEGQDANELWDTDKMQLGLQALILRDNGYTCEEGIIYYRATKQRVRLKITSELESWIMQNLAEARRVMVGPMPAPLVHSPKCARCSLAPVCLPDETRLLSVAAEVTRLTIPRSAETELGKKDQSLLTSAATRGVEAPRRLIASRDDTRPLYLNTPGLRVGCRDEVLQVKEKDSLLEEVRIRDVCHVALFGNIQISTQAIQALCEQEVPVTYFSMGGWFYGITRGHELRNVFLRMEQFRLARDETTCLALARQMVHGKIRNHRTMVMRNHVEPPEPAILKLKRASEDALNARSREELLGIEGAAASLYFQQFNGMIKAADDLPRLATDPGSEPDSDGETAARGDGGNGKPVFTFKFENRKRRPPTDPVNAMLSLAYSLLTKDCTLAAVAVGFDPYIGFYHQPRFGRPALGLDLLEEFRPLIAESTVLNCINNRVITEKDFVRAGQAVNLTAPGRKRFFQTYEQRMSSLITHPLFDYKVSYRRALELQARLLAKSLTGEIPEYVPLLTR
jgi:CRISPR-associated protein Cas1